MGEITLPTRKPAEAIRPDTPIELAQPVVVEKAPEILVKKQSRVAFRNTVPSNWNIQPSDTGITAVNIYSGETFEGSIEDFNAALRG